ncbi:MAG: hypothetical protein AAF479_08220 [Pseudomonadota bacterium]
MIGGPPRYRGNFCAWCNASLTPHQTVTTKSCGAPKCERERTAELARAQTARRAQEHEDLKTRLATEHAGQIAAFSDRHDFPKTGARVMVTPFNGGTLAPVPEERLAGLEAHLIEVAAEGFAIEDPETLSWPTQRTSAVLPEPEAADAGCITCQGGCCRPGGPSWGFIGKDEVCRYRIANPEATEADFVAYYLGHAPEQSISGSCIFHTMAGCTMSREDRSTLCNTFLCRGVKTMLSERARDGDAPTIVIGAENGEAFNLGAYAPGSGFLGTERVQERADAGEKAD